MVTQNRTLVKWFITVTVGQFTRKVEREGIYDASNIQVYPDGRVSLFQCEAGGLCPILPEQITEMRIL